MTSTPDDSTKTPAPRIHRFRIGLNVGVQVILGLILFGLVNYLGARQFKQWDLTFNSNFTLAQSTQDFLKKVTVPVKVTVLTIRGTEAEKDLSALLDQYKKHAKGKLDISIIDTRRDVQAWEAFKAQQFQSKLKLETNGILVQANVPAKAGATAATGFQKWIPEESLYEIDRERQAPTRFKGESLLNSAIMAVTSVDRPKVGIISGLSRPFRPNSDGSTIYDKLKDIAARQNFELEPWPILEDVEAAVPEDIKCLLWISPLDLSPREETALRGFIEKPGRALFVCLEPEISTPQLDKFLAQYGIVPQNDRVLVAGNTPSGPVVRFDVEARFLDGSPLTKGIVSQSTTLLGRTRSLKFTTDTEKQRAENIEVKPLLSPPADVYWGDVKFNDPLPELDKSEDNAPPLYLAVAAERGAARDPRVQMQSSRMLVFGNSVFLEPDALNPQNFDFLQTSMSWLLHRDVNTANDSETDKVKHRFKMQISAGQWRRVFIITAVILPLAALMMALTVWSSRRS